MRPCDKLHLAFFVYDQICTPLILNCGLSVAPWFFIKVNVPMVTFLCTLGQRVLAYLYEYLGASKPHCAWNPMVVVDMLDLGRFIRSASSLAIRE